MGEEGGIYLYKDSDIRKYDGDGDIDVMLNCIPNHYCRDLDGIKYHTFYYGDNVDPYNPFQLDNWGYKVAQRHGISKDVMNSFLEWLEYKCNSEQWEVWT